MRDEKQVKEFQLTEQDDPWELPELSVKSTPWRELTVRGKIWRVTWAFLRFALLIGFLYMFICSLDFLGTAFKLLGGKTAGKAFRESELFKNPIAGLMIGVLVTVLVQSSSTSTSIIITMVGATLLNVKEAVFIIMGANIGTTVTNTIVSLAQSNEKNEFRRAFGAATVHDMFNWLTVLILLPIEAASSMLQRLTHEIIEAMNIRPDSEFGDTKKDILKVITKPFTSLVIKIDKKVITNVAKANTTAELDAALSKDILVTWCKTKELKNVTEMQEFPVPCNTTSTMMNAISTTIDRLTGTQMCTEYREVTEEQFVKERCPNLFAQGKGDTFKLSDTVAGVILLIVSIIILCICLACIVKLLQSIFRGAIARVIRKFLNNDFPGCCAWFTGYVAILVGAGLTIIVQSSSIFTSTITPLVGVGVIKLDRMYPLTLGSNIGTTTTGILAALASDGDELENTLQLALCHLFFNIIGIIIWYPVPVMRKLPIFLAKKLGNTTADYRWFAIFYLFLMFFILPAVVFGLSLAGWYVLLAVAGPIVLLLIFVIIINIMQKKCSSKIHPAKLRSWEWLPLPLRSLQPFDNFLRKTCCRCACCKALCPDNTTEDDFHAVQVGNGKDNQAYMNDAV